MRGHSRPASERSSTAYDRKCRAVFRAARRRQRKNTRKILNVREKTMKKSEITTADRKQKRRSGKKRIVLWSVLGVLALALLAAGIYVWHVLKRPDVFFDSSVRVSANLTPEPTPLFDIDAYLPTDEPGTTPIPTAIPAGPTATPAIVTEDPAADQPAASQCRSESRS